LNHKIEAGSFVNSFDREQEMPRIEPSISTDVNLYLFSNLQILKSFSDIQQINQSTYIYYKIKTQQKLNKSQQSCKLIINTARYKTI
jgi:hypothetical protein